MQEEHDATMQRSGVIVLTLIIRSLHWNQDLCVRRYVPQAGAHHIVHTSSRTHIRIDGDTAAKRKNAMRLDELQDLGKFPLFALVRSLWAAFAIRCTVCGVSVPALQRRMSTYIAAVEDLGGMVQYLGTRSGPQDTYARGKIQLVGGSPLPRMVEYLAHQIPTDEDPIGGWIPRIT